MHVIVKLLFVSKNDNFEYSLQKKTFSEVNETFVNTLECDH